MLRVFDKFGMKSFDKTTKRNIKEIRRTLKNYICADILAVEITCRDWKKPEKSGR